MTRMIWNFALGTAAAIAVVGGISAWTLRRPEQLVFRVGTNPGGVRQRDGLASFKPAAGDSMVAFSAGCFWGAEQAFRKQPGVVATAVGYSGGNSIFPSYEVAHKTGHLETVLVEFDPKKTSMDQLLKVFWTLPRSKNPKTSTSPKSSYLATIWTYSLSELNLAEQSRAAMEKVLHYKLAVKVLPACPFYLAEEYHQQYDEKSGKELCPAIP